MARLITCPQCGTEFDRDANQFCTNAACGYPVSFMDDERSSTRTLRLPAIDPSPPSPVSQPPAPPLQRAPEPTASSRESRTVLVAVEPAGVRLTPGDVPASVDVRVVNRTPIVDEFAVEAVDIGPWLLAWPVRIQVYPGHEARAQLQLHIPEGTVVERGVHTIGVRVVSTTDPNIAQVQPLQVEVAAKSGTVSLEVRPQIVRGNRKGRLVARIANGSNSRLDLTLSGHDAEGAVTFRISPQHLQVPPGGVSEATVEMTSSRPVSGQERQRTLTIQASGAQAPLPAAATFIQTPSVTRGRVVAARVLCTLAGAGLLALSGLMTWAIGLIGLDLDHQNVAEIAVQRDQSWLDLGTSQWVTSVGLVALVLAGLGVLGLVNRRGFWTKFAGVLGLLLSLGFIGVVLARTSESVGIGAWTAVLGSALMLVGGYLAR